MYPSPSTLPSPYRSSIPIYHSPFPFLLSHSSSSYSSTTSSSTPRILMQHHSPRTQPQPRQMRMPGHNIREIRQFDPKHALQVSEFGVCFLVERIGFRPGQEGVEYSLRHLITDLTPEGLPLGGGQRAADPGCVCKKRMISDSLKSECGKEVLTLTEV